MVKRHPEKEVKDLALKVLSTIIAAGIVANVTVIYHFNERLARIETQLLYITPQTHTSASK